MEKNKAALGRLMLLAIMFFCAVSCQRKTFSVNALQFPDQKKVWKLYSINGVATPIELPNRQIPFLIFSAVDNRVSGSGGCNRFTGSFSTEGNGRLSIGPLASTRMACENLSKENDFFATLSKVMYFKIRHQKLFLMSDSALNGGKMLLVFIAEKHSEK